MSRLKSGILFKSLLIILFCSGINSNISAQYSIRDSSLSFVMIGFTAAYQMPGGDIAERFGNDINIGALFQRKSRSNWIVGVEANFFFSDNVKENHILDKYMTAEGFIINGNGEFGEVTLSERGFKLELKCGKIFPVIGPNKNSGLMTTLGVGYLQHKIYIDTPGNPVPFLEDDNRKGFDRLTTGLALTEFIGYANFSNSRLANFYAGLEFTQGFTKNRRAMNFDTGQTDDKSRLDMLFGIRIGWVFPMYKRVADKLYFN